MKKLLFVAFFATLFLACTKESQIAPQTLIEASEYVQSDTSITQTFTATDREASAYQFGLINSTLYPYCFTIVVKELATGKKVWNQGGCYSQNTFYTVNLIPGRQYTATLSFTPNNIGQKGTIHWFIRNYLGYVMCHEGNMGIPSSQSLLWTACQ